MENEPVLPGRFELVILAASAGGLPTVLRVLKPISRTFPAAIIFIQHMAPAHESLLPQILAQKTGLAVQKAEDRQVFSPGNLYVAPPGRDLMVRAGRQFCLANSANHAGSSPSIDLLFESAAYSLRERALVVVLSGMGSDGTDGARAVKAEGGVVIAEDPGSALFPSMPHAAIVSGWVDYVLPADAIGPKIMELMGMDKPL